VYGCSDVPITNRDYAYTVATTNTWPQVPTIFTASIT
jgi:hypothetical protein